MKGYFRWEVFLMAGIPAAVIILGLLVLLVLRR
jgi:hypothetical protein